MIQRPHVDSAEVKSGKLFSFVFDRDDVKVNWEFIEPMLERSVAVSEGTVSMERLQEMLFSGDACAMGTKVGDEIQCILVVTPVDYATYRVARVLALAGRGFKEMFEKYFSVLETWAYSMGAVEIEGWCALEGMVRIHEKLGARKKFSIMTYDIRRKLQ